MKKGIFVWFMLTTTTVFSLSCHAAQSIQHFKATTEQFDAVPVTLGNATEWRTIYFVPLNNLKPGDILEVFSEGQVRNDLNYVVELAQTITISKEVMGGAEDFAVQPNSYSTRYVSPINGWNVTPIKDRYGNSFPGAHYGKWTKVGTYVIEHDDPTIQWTTNTAGQSVGATFVCMRVRARSTDALPNQALTVNLGQGFLSIVKHSQ